MSYRDLELASESNYFKLVTGENRIRLVSAPVKLWTAFDKESITGKKALKFLTEDAAVKYNATVVDEKKKAKAKYAVWILDRATNEVVMAEFGTMILQAVKNLSLDSTYGFEDLPPYDIRITKTGEDMATRYAVLPLPPTELTEDEKKRVEAVGDLTLALREECEDKSAVAPF
jgi:hypothetical protein